MSSAIRIYDKTLSLLGEMDNYANAYFERQLYKAGKFAIEINTELKNAELLQVGNFVMFGKQKDSSGIITKVERTVDFGQAKTKATGYQALHVFSWRLPLPSAGNDYFSITTNAETLIKTMLSNQCGPASDLDRRFGLLNILPSQERGSVQSIRERYVGNVLDVMTKVGVAAGIGFDLQINETTKKLDFEIIPGIDRTAGQSTNGRAIFSEQYDTLKKFLQVDLVDGYRNYAYTAGQGIGSERTIIESFSGAAEPTDLDRKEMYIDARDLSNEDALQNRAEQRLIQNGVTRTIDGTPLSSSQLKYRTDYNLGDKVTIGYKTNTFDAKITSIAESYEPNSYEIELQFDRDQQSLPDQVHSALATIATVLQSVEIFGQEDTDMPTGAISLWSTEVAPNGWLLCQGAAVSRATYAALFQVIGTTYGAGDGTSTFNLPDFRETSPYGVGTRATGVTASDTATLGQFKDDRMQQITGTYTVETGMGGINSTGVASGAFGKGPTSRTSGVQVRTTASNDLTFDSANSPNARTGTSTRGKIYGINFIIKT